MLDSEKETKMPLPLPQDILLPEANILPQEQLQESNKLEQAIADQEVPPVEVCTARKYNKRQLETMVTERNIAPKRLLQELSKEDLIFHSLCEIKEFVLEKDPPFCFIPEQIFWRKGNLT